MGKKFDVNYGNTGFTLIEALVAAVILVVGIGGALGAISAGLRAETVADYYQTSTWLLQDKLTELSSSPKLEAGQKSGIFDEPAGFRWLTDSSEGPEGLWLVKIQVTAPQEQMNSRQGEIVTYLLKR
jgi:type II secretory pathway pseudopilin PulG